MDIDKLVSDRKIALDPIYQRMDETRKLLYLEKYELKDFDDQHKLSDVVNVTLNSPAVFANSMITDLMRVIFQWQIEGSKKVAKTLERNIRNFIQDGLAQIDEQLVQGQGMPSLHSWLSSHVVARSLIGARLVSQIVNGEYIIDGLPVDMRWCPWQFDKKGLEWACNITFRDYAQIKAEYPDYQGAEGDKGLEVRDFWNRDLNVVKVNNTVLLEQKNPFGKVPFVIVLPSVGFMLRDSDYLKYESQDVLWLNKDLYNEDNRFASIAATKGMETVRPPYQEKVKDMDASPARTPPGMGETKKAPIDGGWEPLKRPDINQAFLDASNVIRTALKQGGHNDIDLGNVSPQDLSAIMLSKQAEIRSKFHKPRIEALEIFYQQFARMMIEQYNSCLEKSEDKQLQIGQTGRKRIYGNLGDPTTYAINAKLMSHDKTMEIANASIASALWGKLPDEWIIEKILNAEDTDEIMKEISVQKGRQSDPFIALFELAIRYAEDAEDLDEVDADIAKLKSMKLTDMCVNLLRQGNMPKETQPQEKPNTNALAALAARGGGGVQVGG